MGRLSMTECTYLPTYPRLFKTVRCFFFQKVAVLSFVKPGR